MLIDKDGYILIRKTNHPFCNINGYVREHRLVYEEYYNCILLPYTQIHHIDGNVQNNKIENLIPCYNGQHTNKYHKKDMSDRYCLLCSSNKTLLRKRNNQPIWFKFLNEFICHSCFHKERYRKSKAIRQ